MPRNKPKEKTDDAYDAGSLSPTQISPVTNNDNVKTGGSNNKKTSPIVKATSNIIALLDKKLTDQQSIFEKTLKLQEERLKSLVLDSEGRVVQRLGDVVANISNIRSDIQSISSDIVKVNERCDSVEHDVINIQNALSALQNEAVAADVIITNVPNEVDARVALDNIISLLPSVKLRVYDVFHIQRIVNGNNTASNCVPIIAKFQSPGDRIQLLRGLADLRKKEKKKQLTLEDIRLSGQSIINVHECFSSINKTIFNTALRYRQDNKIASAFTLRGFVYIRKCPESRAIKINNVEELNKAVGVSTSVTDSTLPTN